MRRWGWGGWLGGARGFVPERLARPGAPQDIGEVARGRDLLAGRHFRDGQQIEAPGRSIWDLAPGQDAGAMAVQGFGWLDDLAALGGPVARDLARGWLDDWITRHGDGRGPGWETACLAARLGRWVAHGDWLLQDAAPKMRDRFLSSFAAQCRALARSAPRLPDARERVLALSALLGAETALHGAPLRPARRATALGRAIEAAVGRDGAIASRDPEALLDLLCALNGAAGALGAAAPSAIDTARERIAPVLRALRHADGGLARFHGGGRGAPGRLDRALRDAKVTPGAAASGLRMGFARLAAGRATVILDAAAPPTGPRAVGAHAATLAFEMTCGRRPLIVSCGSGLRHGPDWRRAGRATPSHSTLCLEGLSSARLGPGPRGVETLVDGPREVSAHRADTPQMQRVEASHDAWRAAFGLTHDRRLGLERDGGALLGEDLLTTLGTTDERAFGAASRSGADEGVAFAIRFHLHPHVAPELDLQAGTALLRLRSGEVWMFSHDGGARLSLAPSVYLEKSRPRPVPTQQVVLSGRAMAYATLVRWSLVRMGDAVPAPRDIRRGEDDPA